MDYDITEKLLDMHLQSKELGIQVNVIDMYEAFRKQHKETHGSFKKYLSSPNGLYEQKMQERYDWALNQVQQVIASKYQYQKENPRYVVNDGLYDIVAKQNKSSVL